MKKQIMKQLTKKNTDQKHDDVPGRGLFKTWKEVMFSPMQFYAKLSDQMRYKEPSLFFIKIQAVTQIIVFFFLFIVLGSFLSFLSLLGGGPFTALFGSIGAGMIFILLLLLFPLVLLFSFGMLFLGTGMLHLFVLFFGGKQKYVETFKAASYANAPILFSVIPIVGWLVFIYIMVLQIIGIHKRQKLEIGKILAWVLLPIVIFGSLAFIFFLLFFFTLFSGAGI